MFLHEGRIVSIEGRSTPQQVWDAREEGTIIPRGFPVAVMVNRFSASAAEIVSACLQDNKVATIVGERTWGKGSVQNIIELEKGKSALKLTTAGYHRPSGKNIHREVGASESDEWGVHPDEGFAVRFSNRDMKNLGTLFAQRDELTGGDRQPSSADDQGDSPSESEPPFVDRQLEKAVDAVLSHLIPAPESATPTPVQPTPSCGSDRAGSGRAGNRAELEARLTDGKLKRRGAMHDRPPRRVRRSASARMAPARDDFGGLVFPKSAWWADGSTAKSNTAIGRLAVERKPGPTDPDQLPCRSLSMLVLALETTCDETAAAVVTDRLEVLSSVVASQDALHERFRGVVPEIAARAHVERIIPVIDEALRRAEVSAG